MREKIFRLETAAVLAAAVIMGCFLMVRPIIGVADNGDFCRIMGQTGLEHISPNYDDRYFGYVNREFRVTETSQPDERYYSSEIFLINLAKTINNIVYPNKSIFDIRFLAFIYGCILLTSIFLIIKYNKQDKHFANWVSAAFLVFTFTDIGYISYFNSLYGEAVSMTFLLLTAALGICLVKRKNPSIYVLTGFFMAAVFLVGAKAQNAPTGFILALFGLRLLPLRNDAFWKGTTAIFCLIVAAVSIQSYMSIPDNIKICNKYQTVFYGILKDSPDPEGDLDELGIEKDLAVLAGTNFFMREYPLNIKDPGLLDKINSKVNPIKITAFYIKHPERFAQKMNTAAKWGFQLIQGFGNYEKASNIEYKKTAGPLGLWSNFKMKSIPHSLIFIVLFFSAYFAVLFVQHTRAGSLPQKLYREIFILIGLFGTMQFVIPIIGDGEADLSKHLFLFNVCFDLMMVASVAWTINTIVKILYIKGAIREKL